MRKLFYFFILLLSISVVLPEVVIADSELIASVADIPAAEGHADDGHSKDPHPLSVLPFAILLLMIATGPLFYPHFWHKYYPVIAVVLGLITAGYYLGVLGDFHHPVHALSEYVSFIALIAALFVSCGGILIKVDRRGTPLVNAVLLFIGAAMANVIGTTGASMLLIRPFVRLNQTRIKPYHIVFFIFVVSNVGGSLTPIGDPPLFLGFLKGVPFFWTLSHLFTPWVFGVTLLCLIFFFVDRRNKAGADDDHEYTGKIEIKGLRNIAWLLAGVACVFLDPNKIDWLPHISYHGDKLSFVREILMLLIAFGSFVTADKTCLKGNEFDFEPIKEVGFLFVGIFATMMPALQIIAALAANSPEAITKDSLYWLTGGLSGVLDNAPTYLNFLAAGMGKEHLDIGSKVDVMSYVTGSVNARTVLELMAISVASVFFGAMTYIGNAPNFMVKSIAEQVGIDMPSFVGYIVRYSIPFLLPVLFLTWLIFFAFA